MELDPKQYYKWIVDLCKLMNRPPEDGAILAADPNWIACWIDDMTPKEAFEMYQKHISSEN